MTRQRFWVSMPLIGRMRIGTSWSARRRPTADQPTPRRHHRVVRWSVAVVFLAATWRVDPFAGAIGTVWAAREWRR